MVAGASRPGRSPRQPRRRPPGPQGGPWEEPTVCSAPEDLGVTAPGGRPARGLRDRHTRHTECQQHRAQPRRILNGLMTRPAHQRLRVGPALPGRPPRRPRSHPTETVTCASPDNTVDHVLARPTGFILTPAPDRNESPVECDGTTGTAGQPRTIDQSGTRGTRPSLCRSRQFGRVTKRRCNETECSRRRDSEHHRQSATGLQTHFAARVDGVPDLRRRGRHNHLSM